MKIFVITKKMLIIAAAVIFVAAAAVNYRAVVFRWSRFANVRHGTA